MAENQSEKTQKKKNMTIRIVAVVAILLLFGLGILIAFRTEYLNMKEIGEQYTELFFKNVNNRLYLAGGIFVVTYLVIYISNKLTKHGLKKFFDDEKKQIPKLPNKTFAIIGAIVFAIIGMMMLNEKYTMFVNSAWFGKTDPVFDTDIAYYIFTLPFIESLLFFMIGELICLIIYTAFYYVVVINLYLDGVDIELLKKNTFIKQIVGILVLIALLFSGYIFLTSQNVLTQDMLTLENTNNIDLTGAGKTDVTIKLWGYRILAIVLFISIVRLLKYATKSNFKQAMISILIVPTYLVAMFVSMVYYEQFIVKKEVLDNQKQYIGYNIENTKEAYGINIEQQLIDSYGTITYDEIAENADVIPRRRDFDNGCRAPRRWRVLCV